MPPGVQYLLEIAEASELHEDEGGLIQGRRDVEDLDEVGMTDPDEMLLADRGGSLTVDNLHGKIPTFVFAKCHLPEGTPTQENPMLVRTVERAS